MKILKNKDLIFFILILAVALVIRFWRLDSISPGFSGHGIAQFGLDQEFMRAEFPQLRDTLNIIFLRETGPIALIQSTWYKIVGISVFSMRALPAIIGALSIATAYLIGSASIDRKFGLIFAAYMSASLWHLTFSRYENLEHILPIFISTLLALLTIKIINKPKQTSNYIMLGLLSGLTLYFYASLQVLLPISLVFVLLIFVKKHSSLKLRSINLFSFLLFIFLVSLPQIYFYLQNDHLLPIRKQNYGQDPLYSFSSFKDLPKQFQSIYKEVFVAHTDSWIGGKNGVLSKLEIILFAIGILSWLISKNKRGVKGGYWFVLLLFVGLIPGLIGPHPVPFRRIMLSGIAISYFSAFGVWSCLTYILKNKHKNIQWILTIAVSSLICIYMSQRYFSGPFSVESMLQATARQIIKTIETNPDQSYDVILASQSEIDMFMRLINISQNQTNRLIINNVNFTWVDPRETDEFYQKYYCQNKNQVIIPSYLFADLKKKVSGCASAQYLEPPYPDTQTIVILKKG